MVTPSSSLPLLYSLQPLVTTILLLYELNFFYTPNMSTAGDHHLSELD
jgi:hypothetical protein